MCSFVASIRVHLGLPRVLLPPWITILFFTVLYTRHIFQIHVSANTNMLENIS